MDASSSRSEETTGGPHPLTDSAQDWALCLRMAGLLEQPADRTRAIAELLFSVQRDVRDFDSLDLTGVGPAVTFSAGWDPL
jgi:hypothetical protein